MKPRSVAALGALAIAGVASCSLFVDLGGYAGGAADASAPTDGSAPPRDGGADVVVSSITGTSCKAIHAKAPDAGTGLYGIVAADGGVTTGYCDMESWGGGWTLVTPAMIVAEESVNQGAPTSPAKVTVTHPTDSNGGFGVTVDVDSVNCGKDNSQPGPYHQFRIAELDAYEQVMATYAFFQGTDCWKLFGSSDGPDLGMRTFTPGVDLIDREQNMARDDAGAAIPYDGRTAWCDVSASNFWDPSYANNTRTARVVLRRLSPSALGGVYVHTDCGTPRWQLSSIYVR